MSYLVTRAFWAALIERAVKTFAQSLVAVGLAGATDVLSVDWRSALSVAALATVVSVLTSIASGAVGGDAGPSLTGAEELPAAAVPSARAGQDA